MPNISSFDPVIDKNSRVLILGSMPGKVSLEKGQYYAHPQNQFWNLVFSIFEMSMEPGYEERIAFLKAEKIALWDVIRECERSGSSDSKIKKPVMNDFRNLLLQYPNIKNILFNGNKAMQLFETQVKISDNNEISFFRLPSSSPASARIKLEDKLAYWRVIKDLVSGPC